MPAVCSPVDFGSHVAGDVALDCGEEAFVGYFYPSHVLFVGAAFFHYVDYEPRGDFVLVSEIHAHPAEAVLAFSKLEVLLFLLSRFPSVSNIIP